MQLLWTGPQVPSGPHILFTMPVLSTGHGAWATWPALVTFQATVEESSGQVVSPSGEQYQAGLSNHSLARAFPWAEPRAGSAAWPSSSTYPG